MTDPAVPGPESSPVECPLSHEPPAAIAKRGWRYHHMGIPIDVEHPGETHPTQFGLYVSGFSTSPYGVEWMRRPSASRLRVTGSVVSLRCIRKNAGENGGQGTKGQV